MSIQTYTFIKKISKEIYHIGIISAPFINSSIDIDLSFKCALIGGYFPAILKKKNAAHNTVIRSNMVN